ncbi:MAG: sigma-70 family RNA polymerase sigma factor [Acetobacteraceae bacterium]
MSVSLDLQRMLLDAIPTLRASALSLSGQPDQADDLVQQALLKAWHHIDSFEPGTNMAAWLYTIMRNEFYTEFRRRRREVQGSDSAFSAELSDTASQDRHMDVREVQAALNKLRPEQREALMLVGVWELSYDDAAEICRCAVGTMKSRVNRARGRLAEFLSGAPGRPYPKRTAAPAAAKEKL